MNALEAAITGRVYGFVFAPGRSREDNVGVFTGFVEENILNDDEIDFRERFTNFR